MADDKMANDKMADDKQASGRPPKFPGQDEAVKRVLAQGVQHLQAGQLEQAEKLLREVIIVDPTSSDAMHYLGLVELQRGRPDLCVEIIKQALIVTPNDSMAHSNQGLAYQMMGQFEAAEKAFALAIKYDSRNAEALNNAGTIHQMFGRFEKASKAFERALRARPNFVQAQVNFGLALQNMGRIDLAEKAYVEALKMSPDYADAHLNLGNIHRILGRNVQAIASFSTAIKLQPNYALAHSSLGDALAAIAQYDQALIACNKAIELEPKFAEAYAVRGGIYDKTGRLQDAVADFEKAIALQPNSFMGYASYAATLAGYGDKEGAAKNYDLALERAPKNGDLIRQRANLTRHTKDSDQVRDMQALLEDKKLPKSTKLHLHFALGKAFDDMGAHEQAFAHFSKGNAFVRESFEYSPDEQRDQFEELMDVFDAEFFKKHGAAGPSDPAPVFILGMPRSGTTLVEQILGNHPQVHGSGELLTLPAIVSAARGGKTTAAFAKQVDDARLREMGENYLDTLKKLAPDAKLITDKLPANFLFIGLIKCMLPNAKIIHCTRDPLDNGLSIFKTYFASVGNFYSSDLKEIGAYHTMYQRLMAHWHQVLPGHILDVSYEAMVADQEAETRRIIDHLGLEWSDACLDFTKSERPVHTASLAQVREPIYDRSVGLWRKYGDQLKPLADALNAPKAQ